MDSSDLKCKICSCANELLFEKLILTKYSIKYYVCTDCSFIQTEDPYWLDEAYNDTITKLDIGLIERNIKYSNKLNLILREYCNINGKFLDFGGGYGMLVRMMRDKGFDFYRQDEYTDNLFSENFDINDLIIKEKFEALTAIEVFEHLVNPMLEIKKMLEYSDTIFFTTELVSFNSENIEDWWYIAPETGQHISFYNINSLRYIAKYYDLNFYSDNVRFHLFSKQSFKKNPLTSSTNYYQLYNQFSLEKWSIDNDSDKYSRPFIRRLLYKLIRMLNGQEKPVIESLAQKDYKYISDKKNRNTR
tara:strand:- start:125 stop:1033 length:909 start_codon:yes stop_codon:yes gene_type:complete